MNARNGAKRIPLGLVVTAAIFLHHNAMAVSTVNLGTASSFSILAGSKISDAGGASTIVTGNVGLYPSTGAAIGLTAGQAPGGTIYTAETSGGLLNTAKNDLTTAYIDAAARQVSTYYTSVLDNQLGGKTLSPGVYNFGHADTANLIGTLTLDAQNDPNAVWIFQATSDLITASDSTVALIRDAQACHVFWQVSSSATIGTSSDFVGSIMADQSIALQTGATLHGSALARIAAVTLDHNTIIKANCIDDSTGGPGGTAVPDGGSTLLLFSFGLGILVAFKRKLSRV